MRTSHAQQQIPQTGREAVPYSDWRQMIEGVMLRGAEMQAGTVAGTGAALDVALTFDPAVVVLIDETQNVVAIKHPGQATDIATTIKAAVVGAAAATCTLGTQGQKKFTIGTNADVNTVADVVRWIAIGFSAKGGQ
jgi:cobalamin biosynthesis protein CbiG